MIGDISIKTNIYIICGYTDMRRSIDGLCAIVQDMFHAEPDSIRLLNKTENAYIKREKIHLCRGEEV